MKKQMKSDMRELFGRFDSYTLADLIGRLTEAVEALPEDQRASAKFSVEEEQYDYDPDPRTAFFISWSRPETDEEQTKRVAAEDAAKKQREDYERRQYEALKAKFG